MHVGHARSFLLAWWSARSQGGEIILRIEDLDQARAKDEWARGIQEDLAWLGLDWDGDVVLQSEHLDEALAAAAKLVSAGQVYPCVCSRREVREAASAPHEDPSKLWGEVNYPGTCRGLFSSIQEAEKSTGRKATLRFLVPHEPIEVHDAFLGRRSYALPDHGGDFVVMRRDAQPAYQLGVVVEDARLGVTEVLRGDDLLVSAARQQVLQQALGFPTPKWIHVPLVRGFDGDRLAKRAGSTSLAKLRDEGLQPADLIAWVARSAGIKEFPGEGPASYLSAFSIQNVPKAPATWD
jgi:glutamyl-tRNA synthetase